MVCALHNLDVLAGGLPHASSSRASGEPVFKASGWFAGFSLNRGC